jgi:hypothetical protein
LIHRRHALVLAAAASVSATGRAAAQPLDFALLPGSWRLTAVYDLFEDGSRRETWGARPLGIIQLTPGGLFSAQIMAGDRTARPGTVPSEPVGPSIAYWGRYRLDAAAGVFTTEVEQSSWPQWNGVPIRRQVVELTRQRLKVVADPIRDPARGLFRPHLEFERIE